MIAGVVHGSASGAPGRLAAGGPEGLHRLRGLTVRPGSGTRWARSGDVWCWIDGALYGDEAGAEDRLAAAGPERAAALLGALRGDFAVVVWDDLAGAGWMARDPTAGAGLAYARDGEALAFGSDVADVLALLPATPAPDPVACAHWLNVSAPPGGRTLYSGVHRLPASHMLTLGRDGGAVRRYWAPRYRGVERRTRGEAVEMLRAELTTAVDRRIGAGSTAVLLSGGLDSASVAGVARRLVPPARRPKSAFSAVFPAHPDADESEYVDAIADGLDLESVRLEVRGGSLFPGVAEYFRRWALPPTSPNLFFWLPLFRRASELGVDVLLDGEGGDQVFSLSPYLISDRLRRGRMLSALQLARLMPGAGPDPPWFAVRDKLVNVGVRGALPVAVQRLRRRRSAGERYTPGWFRPETALSFVRSDEQWRWRGIDGPLWWAWLVDQTLGGIGPALTLDHVRQRAAMEGVAVRHPLLDVDLVESVLRIAPELSFDWRYSRPLLREALEGVLPDPVRLRPGKATFDAVFHEALLGRDMPLVRRLLLDPSARVREFVDQDALREQLLDLPPEQYPGGVIWWALPVWRTASLECFLRGIEDPTALEELCYAAA